MYSLVALGFVLIFKASASSTSLGVMVLFAALTLVGLMDPGARLARWLTMWS
jgi:hypothetical protein